MLQKEKSTTTYSKSNTNKGLQTPVQFVKGVGPRLGMAFASRGIQTVKDLLFFFPRTYEDRTQLKTIEDLKEGETATVSLVVESLRKIPTRSRRTIVDVRCTDGTRRMSLKFFHFHKGMEGQFRPGRELTATGLVKQYMGQSEMVHPEISWGMASTEINTGRVVPVYVEIEGISSRVLRKVLWSAIEKFSKNIREDLPASYLKARGLPALEKSIRTIHFPENEGPDAVQALLDFSTPAHQRLIYEEFFKFEYLILTQKLKASESVALRFDRDLVFKNLESLKEILPFQLTGHQSDALNDIFSDLVSGSPMNRLVQGDVGCGKTAVAFLSAGAIMAMGEQAVLMAPTEILAEQHRQNAEKIFGERLNVELWTGKTPARERKVLAERLKKGEPILLIGTHALIEDPVQFKSLSLILIDEQHRFGVDQRRRLIQKGLIAGKTPHVLLMTATPIPRTLALTAYGDVSVSNIRELPPDRSEVVTKIVSKAQKVGAYADLRQRLKEGRQAYFIFPLVNQSEAEGFTELKAATEEAKQLQLLFPEFKVALLHGQMKSDEKARIMDEFSRGIAHILVSTTVVEVGVDVPNSTTMVIEHAERFGLSQLHQLRGRVGRGQHQSYCYLFVSKNPGEISALRLEALEKTNDGFKIAEVDLEIRGPGEFLGTRQSGGLPFRIANIVRDREWLLKSRDDVLDLIQKDRQLNLPEHRPFRSYVHADGAEQAARLSTS